MVGSEIPGIKPTRRTQPIYTRDRYMGRMVYLPTWMVDFYGKCRYINIPYIYTYIDISYHTKYFNEYQESLFKAKSKRNLRVKPVNQMSEKKSPWDSYHAILSWCRECSYSANTTRIKVFSNTLVAGCRCFLVNVSANTSFRSVGVNSDTFECTNHCVTAFN